MPIPWAAVFSVREARRAQIRLPRQIVPKSHGGSGGWFGIKDLVVGENEITGKVTMNFTNAPYLRIDRITGAVSVDGRDGPPVCGNDLFWSRPRRCATAMFGAKAVAPLTPPADACRGAWSDRTRSGRCCRPSCRRTRDRSARPRARRSGRRAPDSPAACRCR